MFNRIIAGQAIHKRLSYDHIRSCFSNVPALLVLAGLAVSISAWRLLYLRFAVLLKIQDCFYLNASHFPVNKSVQGSHAPLKKMLWAELGKTLYWSPKALA